MPSRLLPVKYVEPYTSRRHMEDPDEYQVRLVWLRAAINVTWWGSLLCTVCTSLAVGLMSGVACALIPWACWFGLVAIIGAIVTIAAAA